VVPVVRLTEVFRQAAHSRIITNAHRINEGFVRELTAKQTASDFYFIDRAEPELIAAMLLEMVKTHIPGKFRFDPIRVIECVLKFRQAR
jgi:exodeoxyribonuclease V alpha subunit